MAEEFAQKGNPERVHSDEIEQKAMDLLVKALQRLEQWEEAVSSLGVMDRTSLAGDDRATPYENISSQVRSYLSVAIDHLRTLREVALEGQSLPAMAGFTLIRAAVEAIGTSLWLLGPGSRDVRVLHSLQLARESHHDVFTAEAEYRGTSPKLPEDDATIRRLAEIRDDRPGLRGRSLHEPTMAKRLKEAQAFAENEKFTLIVIWRIASGIAHGGRGMLYELLDREVIETDETRFEVMMKSSFTAVAGMYAVTERHLNHAVALFRARNVPLS